MKWRRWEMADGGHQLDGKAKEDETCDKTDIINRLLCISVLAFIHFYVY